MRLVLLSAALALARTIYALHESGRPYTSELQRLSELTGQQLGTQDVCGAFGSVSEETWARGLLAEHTTYPTDLTQEELRLLLTLVLNAEGEEWQDQHWLECLERGTGCENLTDLIYYPEEYFGENAPDHDLSVDEILNELLVPTRRKRILLTPPPSGSA